MHGAEKAPSISVETGRMEEGRRRLKGLFLLSDRPPHSEIQTMCWRNTLTTTAAAENKENKPRATGDERDDEMKMLLRASS